MKARLFYSLFIGLSLSCSSGMFAQSSDNGDGTFTNPVLWADVPDPDVIRVGDDYYMVSTTMHLMPGAPVMHSRDLVNWEIINYLYDKLDDKKSYDMIDGTVYGRGQWATSLRYRLENGLCSQEFLIFMMLHCFSMKMEGRMYFMEQVS